MNYLLYIGLIDAPLHVINTNFAVQLGFVLLILYLLWYLPIYASVERYNFTFSEVASDLYASKVTILLEHYFTSR